ncbi:MAG: WD40/YVTN/BNR-like repeat-containing protein [Candidatus Krumholzibacteriia bacterium]
MSFVTPLPRAAIRPRRRVPALVLPVLAALTAPLAAFVMSAPALAAAPAAKGGREAAAAPGPREVTAQDLATPAWRGIGPAVMSGRVSAIALVPGSRTDFYVGYATGGVFKTTNLGTTFSEVFRNEATSCIGAIAVADAPENWAGWAAAEAGADSSTLKKPRAERGRGKIVWIGTGEGNGRNSSSWGNGVYRSTDGGAKFTSVGLAQTHDIPALAVDPRDPDVAYVAALGHLWGPNPERGLFRTRDGGATWQQVLKVDSDVGACDVVIDPARPDRVWAALYARRRTPWSFSGVSDKGGIYRSDDAGATWRRLTAGLPARTGRIGLAVFAKNPDVLYAVVESDQGGTGRNPFDDFSPAGGLFRTADGGETWVRVNELSFRPFYFSRLAVDPQDEQRLYLPGWDLSLSDDGGRTLRRTGSPNVHVDQHAIAVDPADPRRILLGTDGGLYASHDRADTWDWLDQLDVGQFYHVNVDLSDPYRVGGGLQDNGSWLGPSAATLGAGEDDKPGILNEDWRFVFGGDGFRVVFDPTDANVVYASSQGGNLGRVRLDTNLIQPLRMSPDEGQERPRFNWDAPFLLSKHDPTVLYQAGNRVYKLTARGDFWYAISGDLSRRQTDRIMTEGSDAETYGTVTALAESPLRQGTLWAGTDDGLIHLTTDDGANWADVTPKAVGGLYVSGLEASARDARTAYAAIDGHRSDVFRPLILLTEDGGRSWRELQGDLPADSPVRVVREDPANPDVLYCGTETGAYVTLDRGKHWLRPGGKSLPTAPVYDLAIHPREHDLIAATHGRSLWILDDATCFAGLTPAAAAAPLTLFPVRPAAPRLIGSRGYGGGARLFVGANPPAGALVTYWLRDLPAAEVSVKVEDAAGATVRTLGAPARPGLNRTTWDLQPDPKNRYGAPNGQTEFVPPGEYTVVVSVGGSTQRQKFTVARAANWVAPEEKGKLPPANP